jgi:hypothetical protein
LPDLGSGTYQSFAGGLYLNGSNQLPPSVLAYAVSLAGQIKPLNPQGTPDASGMIGLLAIGDSYALQEWSGGSAAGYTPAACQPMVWGDPARNWQLMPACGALGGMGAAAWARQLVAEPYAVVNQLLTYYSLTGAQVQIAWWGEPANPLPQRNDGVFPASAQKLQGYIEGGVRWMLQYFPNLKILYLSPRTHSYALSSDPNAVNPEPYAFESGFSIQWAIQGQYRDWINGTHNHNLNFDPTKGAVVAPLLLWGPYLWATSGSGGAVLRSDGCTWNWAQSGYSDLSSDQIQPSFDGANKVASQLMAFFRTHPTATPWALRPVPTGQAPVVTVNPPAATIVHGSSVSFTASASGFGGAPINDYFWTFDDGLFAYGKSLTKRFPTIGSYNVKLTVDDSQGNTTVTTVPVTVQ